MKPEDRLNIDEVMCLQMAGMSTPEIMHTDLKAFDRLYADHEEVYSEFIDRANSILDRQERLGITSYSCQDDDFPARLKASRPPPGLFRSCFLKWKLSRRIFPLTRTKLSQCYKR